MISEEDEFEYKFGKFSDPEGTNVKLTISGLPNFMTFNE